MPDIHIERLTAADTEKARALFTLLSEVFETESGPLSEAYVTRLLTRDDFWALTASVDGQMVGGLTAYTLPLTRREEFEIFLYDIAVRPSHQRCGIGRQLVRTLRTLAAAEGISVVWVPADNEDEHALDFYRALGGESAPVTIFTFSQEPR